MAGKGEAWGMKVKTGAVQGRAVFFAMATALSVFSPTRAGAAPDAAPPAKETPTDGKQAAGWLKDAAGVLRDRRGGEAGAGALSVETVVAGLKQGLDTGVDRALAELGKPDGFFANPEFKIPLPGELAKGEQVLRKLGQDALADELILSLNRAAEKSVAETAPIFKDAITNMSLADARAILDGPADAATSYFRKNTEEKLRAKMMPIVTAATDASGVGAAYKRFAGRAAPVSGLLGPKATASLDLDRYVTDRALDGLFKVVAAQEAQLRADPAGAATELLKRVFGAAAKG